MTLARHLGRSRRLRFPVGSGWVLLFLLLALGCSPSRPPAEEADARESASMSSLGIPYGATIRCSHPTLAKPLVGYFHAYRDGSLILNVGAIPYDSTTQVEVLRSVDEETPVCDTLERAAQWSVLAEGQWVTLYGLHGNRVARGRVNLVLPETLYVEKRHISQDSVCRLEVAWRDNSEHSRGWWAIPVTIGKTVIKVAGLPPILLWSLVSSDAQPLKRWMNW
jgi:hypothetical protein